MLTMRDSIDPWAIPLTGLDAVAGYGDGLWTWPSAGWARFPPPIVPLVVVVSAQHAGDILDVERTDALPSDCPGWADRFNRPGRRRPSIYCDRSTIAAVRAAMDGRPFDWWAATLDGTVSDTTGAVAVQWKGSDLTGGQYDESLIMDPSWIAAPPVPAPAPGPHPKERRMPVKITRADGTQDVFDLVGGQLHHVVIDPGNVARFNDVVPGDWAAVLDAWWAGQSLTVRGLGADGGLWLSTWTAGTWGQPVGAIS